MQRPLGSTDTLKNCVMNALCLAGKYDERIMPSIAQNGELIPGQPTSWNASSSAGSGSSEDVVRLTTQIHLTAPLELFSHEAVRTN